LLLSLIHLRSSHLSVSEVSPQAVLPRLDDISSNIHEVLKLVRAQIQQGTPKLDSESCIVYSTKIQDTGQLALPCSVALTESDQPNSSERNPSTDIPLRPKVYAETAHVLSSQDSSDGHEVEKFDSVSSIEPSSFEIQSQILDTHQAVMGNMQACLQSAGSLISSVSTALSTDAEPLLASDFNGSIPGDRRIGIEDWITSAESIPTDGDKLERQG
jgi:hypothetical protein